MSNIDLLAEVTMASGQIAPGRLSAELRITKRELALASGLSRDAVSKTSRLDAPTT